MAYYLLGLTVLYFKLMVGAGENPMLDESLGQTINSRAITMLGLIAIFYQASS